MRAATLHFLACHFSLCVLLYLPKRSSVLLKEAEGTLPNQANICVFFNVALTYIKKKKKKIFDFLHKFQGAVIMIWYFLKIVGRCQCFRKETHTTNSYPEENTGITSLLLFYFLKIDLMRQSSYCPMDEWDEWDEWTKVIL